MCTAQCSKFIGIALYVLAAVSVICNIVLFFPDFKTEYAADDRDGKNRITPEVKYMGGLIGGGIMVLIPAIHIHLTSTQGCCGNRCGMFLSIGFAAAGAAGAVYSLSVASLGLANGPTCRLTPLDILPIWRQPFLNNERNYLENRDMWKICLEPENVVQFNVALFSVLLVAAGIELVLCVIQMVNGLFGCLCGSK
ncbi:transmembrane 4 L6 family member 1 [Polymixia lowei]